MKKTLLDSIFESMEASYACEVKVSWEAVRMMWEEQLRYRSALELIAEQPECFRPMDPEWYKGVAKQALK